MRRRKSHSMKIRIAMVITSLILTPGALGIGILLKHNIIKESSAKAEISLIDKECDALQKEKDLSVNKNL